MSLLKKSNENIKAADLLIQNKLFNPSIHACYYANYQILIKIEKTLSNDVNPKTIDSHEKTITAIFSSLKNLNSNLLKNFNLEKIKESILDLKRKRTKADYHEKIFNNDETQNIYELSCKLHKQLSDIYDKIKPTNL